jgi:hypothetical protein
VAASRPVTMASQDAAPHGPRAPSLRRRGAAATVPATMQPRRRFPDDVVAALRDGKALRIRAGIRPHRFIGIWVVVVEGRVFVRSWSLKRRSWWRTFLEEPRGAIQAAGRAIPVRAVRTSSERLKNAVDRAYLEKYGTGASLKYARDLGSARSRATTTELVPI